uniref:Fas-binding factor 1 C-terminal domain-containing protein n=1 Tax=Sander lucioperca TaxID=283035 RepID=A0A8D0D4J2_SANLU
MSLYHLLLYSLVSIKCVKNLISAADLDDPLADLLDDLLPDETKPEPKSTSPILKTETSKAAKKRSDVTFDDDKDDLMDALGFDKPLLEDDLTFGSYQPTLGSTPEGRQSRRPSVRFSTDEVNPSTPEKKPKPTTPTRHRNSADWLGLKTKDDHAFSETDTPALTENITKQTKPEISKSQQKEEEEDDDWLAGALSRKKAMSVSNSEAKTTKQENFLALGEEMNLASTVRYNKKRNTVTRTMTEEACFSVLNDNLLLFSVNKSLHKLPGAERTPLHLETNNNLPCRPKFPSYVTSIYMHSLKLLCVIVQVKTLQLEREQSQMLLESVQQRHKQDMELMENTHKARVKLLEESAAQRETQARQECEDLMERLATVTRSAEQERSELQTQYQRKLALAQQDRDREVERIRDLQRKSVLEMKKDHEDQVQRLKKLKDEEIDAVTSATSQTRSLTVVIEQMEQFSSRLGDISSRVESTHEHTAHGLEQGTRHRDEQLRMMQDRLAQQQKAMAEERSYLKEIISRMDTQLNEQQRQLEKDRWKITAEQAKAESTQRGLEGERHALSIQINMEREELERAKSALLEEQKSVMQHCAEERRKLAAEWAHFHTMEKQRHERAERDINSLLEKREGSIISLAQEQADLKLHTAELKQKELAVAQERETLERLREELDREKERISSTALRLKTRAHEVEAFSKLAAEKFEEGEGALQEAKRVEAEHEARLRNIHSQTERLRQQEQRILQVRVSVYCKTTLIFFRLGFYFTKINCVLVPEHFLLQERMRLSHLQKDTERLQLDTPITSLAQIIPPTLPGEVNSGN